MPVAEITNAIVANGREGPGVPKSRDNQIMVQKRASHRVPRCECLQDEIYFLYEMLRLDILSRISVLPKHTPLYIKEICSVDFWSGLNSSQRRIAGAFLVRMVAIGDIYLIPERYGNIARMYSIP
jgi:hypothetical protein